MSDTPAPQADHAAEPVRDPAAPEREARVRLLLSRLAASPDLPSLSESVRTIQKILRTDRAHLRSLSDEILQDVALSSKLLRLVSAAFYRSVGGDSVDSISRAVSLLGFDALSRLAGSMKFFDRLPASMVGTRVQAEFARALLAAITAHELHPSLKEGELVYLSGLFQNLGRMLVWMHFPQDAERVVLRAEQDLADGVPEGEDTAARQCRRARLEDRHAQEVLGIGFEDLGAEIARMWGWPESMQRALRPMMPEDYAGPHPGEDRVRLVASLGNQLASVIAETPQEALDEALAAFQARWRMFLGDDPKPFQALLGRVERQWSVLAPVTRVAESAAPKVRGAQPPARPGAQAPAGSAPGWPAFSMAGAMLRQREVPRPQAPHEDREGAAARPGRRQAVDPAEHPRPGGEVAALGNLVGRLGAGAGMPRMLVNFTVQPAGGEDLFALACSKGLDTLIDDGKRPATWRNLPVWFRRRVAAPCFLLLPLRSEDACIGLIYVDHDEPGGLKIDPGQLQLIQALRDELVQALLRRAVRPLPA